MILVDVAVRKEVIWEREGGGRYAETRIDEKRVDRGVKIETELERDRGLSGPFLRLASL